MVYLYLAKQIGIAGAFAVWAYIVAKGLFARSSLRLSPAEEVALLVPAGLAVAVVLLFGLGLAGILTAPGILAGAGVALALAGWRLRGRFVSGLSGTVRAFAFHETPARLIMIAIAGTVLVPVALNGLTPPHYSDEVRYHLPYALHFVEQGRIVPDLDLRFPFFTLNVNLLYATAIVFGDNVTPHYVHLLLGCLAGLALYVLAVPRFGRVTALCAVMVFFVTPNFRVFAATAYIDLGLAAFITSTIACLDRARGRPALIVCAGLAFGAALGSKYLALALVPILIAWAAYRTRAGLQVARFAAVTVLTGAPWYVYNLIWTGNPISPFAGEWFGYWPWTAEDLAGQMQELTNRGHDLSLAGLLSLPSSVPKLLIPGLVALVLLPWWDRHMRPYGIVVLVFVTIWFFTAAYIRYVTLILPLWCLITVWSVERALRPVVSHVARQQATLETTRRHASFAAATIVLVLAEYHFWLHNRWLDHDAVTERVVHRDRFLRDTVDVYGVAQHLRREDARDEVIFAFPPGALFSYARPNRVVGDYFGPMAYHQKFLPYSLCKGRFVSQLQQMGVSLLVVSHKPAWLSAWNDYFSSRLASEYADQHTTVFRIRSDTDPPAGNSRFLVEGDKTQVIPHFEAGCGKGKRAE